jgi:hypothetical protein
MDNNSKINAEAEEENAVKTAFTNGRIAGLKICGAAKEGSWR